MKSDKASPRLVDHPVEEIHLPLKDWKAEVSVTEKEIIIRYKKS